MPLPPSTPKIVFAANRPIGLRCLRMLLRSGITPVGLLLARGANAECADEMRALLPGVPCIRGTAFREPAGLARLRRLDIDYILSVHFPYLIPNAVLALPARGTLNLHPAYLPWNRGWHTPSWAILDGTPYGATLHWVDDGVDTGPIALQKRVPVKKTDTADALYRRALDAEASVFRSAIPLLKRDALPKRKQRGKGSSHAKADLESMRRIDLASMSDADIDRRIRALTTNRPEEAAYIEIGGHRHLVANAQVPRTKNQ